MEKEKKFSGRTDEIDIYIVYYMEKAEELLNYNAEMYDLVELWYECLKIIYDR